jgi:hypothetical protein
VSIYVEGGREVRVFAAHLFMLKEDAKSAARNFLQDSQNCLAGVLREGSLGGGHTSGEMRLGRRVSRAESALLFRFRPAHGATNRQYLSQRELIGLHTYIIDIANLKRWSIVPLRVSIGPKMGISLEPCPMPSP